MDIFRWASEPSVRPSQVVSCTITADCRSAGQEDHRILWNPKVFIPCRLWKLHESSLRLHIVSTSMLILSSYIHLDIPRGFSRLNLVFTFPYQ